MSERSTDHGTFVIERTYPATPARVFGAFASAEAKASWFGPSSLGRDDIELDFRVGGEERFEAEAGGARYTYRARYQDIVPEQRIVYTYEMDLDDERISVSVATIELAPAAQGTRLTLTEQGVFLDGHDTNAAREHGTRALLEQLAGDLA
jgi:uncharacterized protein YndB with AHSA1/START domain